METEKKISNTTNEKNDWKKYFNYSKFVKDVKYILFLSVLAIAYIYNGHYADKLSRKISKTDHNVKELEYEYKTIKSEVIYRSKATEIIKSVEALGLKELKQPPILLSSKDSTKQ